MCGKDGIGKKEFAKEFAKKILCLGDNKGTCKSCLEFDSGNHPDFLIIGPQDGSIKIEQVRNLMSKAIEKPIIGEKKVYIIDNAEEMTKEAQNCLLKTLEEPPKYMVIILIVKNESEMLTTIKSRCTKVAFNKIEDNALKRYLENNLGFEKIDESRLRSFDGSIGEAIKWREKQELYSEVEAFFDKIQNMDEIDLLNNQNVLYKNKDDIVQILSYLNMLFYKKTKSKEPRLIAKYIKCIEIIENTKKRLNYNGNFDMCIDNMLLSINEAFSI